MADRCRIRPTASADLGALALLEQDAFSDPWTSGMIAEALSSDGAMALVADADGEVVGSIIARRVADEGEILTVAVAPSRRRTGLGRRLLDAVLGQFREAGVAAVWLEVRASNLPARGMYQAAGFVAAGLRRGYYRRPTEDAIILRCDLSRREAPPGSEG